MALQRLVAVKMGRKIPIMGCCDYTWVMVSDSQRDAEQGVECLLARRQKRMSLWWLVVMIFVRPIWTGREMEERPWWLAVGLHVTGVAMATWVWWWLMERAMGSSSVGHGLINMTRWHLYKEPGSWFWQLYVGGLVMGPMVLAIIGGVMRQSADGYWRSVCQMYKRHCVLSVHAVLVIFLVCWIGMWLDNAVETYWESSTSAGDAMTRFPWHLRNAGLLDTLNMVYGLGWLIAVAVWMGLLPAKNWDAKQKIGWREKYPSNCIRCGYVLYDFPKRATCAECGCENQRCDEHVASMKIWDVFKWAILKPWKLVERMRIYEPTHDHVRYVLLATLIGLIIVLPLYCFDTIQLLSSFFSARQSVNAHEMRETLLFVGMLFGIAPLLMTLVNTMICSFVLARWLKHRRVYLGFACGCYISPLYWLVSFSFLAIILLHAKGIFANGVYGQYNIALSSVFWRASIIVCAIVLLIGCVLQGRLMWQARHLPR